MSRVTLCLSAKRQDRRSWMDRLLVENHAAVAKVDVASYTVTLVNGDRIMWCLLDESIRGIRCDELIVDPDMERGRLDDRQREMLLVARTLVRPAWKKPPAD